MVSPGLYTRGRELLNWWLDPDGYGARLDEAQTPFTLVSQPKCTELTCSAPSLGSLPYRAHSVLTMVIPLPRAVYRPHLFTIWMHIVIAAATDIETTTRHINSQKV